MKTKTLNDVNLNIAKDYQELSKFAADFVLQRIKANPAISLLVPTGTTPEGFYAIMSLQPEHFFDNVTFYNLDEYCVMGEDGKTLVLMPETDERSYRYYMSKHLFARFPNVKSYFPGIENVEHEGAYDELIAQNGGIDLCVNAIGEEGHTFGFNLPGTPVDSKTRLVKMSEDARKVNKKLTGRETPEYAVTTGLQTGMSSKEVILLISGKRKAQVLKEVILGEITPEIPVTILRNHPNCTWVIDEEAASELVDKLV